MPMRPQTARRAAPGTLSARWLPRQIPNPHQGVDRPREGEHPARPPDAAMPRRPEQRDRLGPAEVSSTSFRFRLLTA